MTDEFQREIPYNPCSGGNSNSDIWWPKYDSNKHCFTFRMWHYDAERYLLSREQGTFHILIGCREAMYCFTYPKSLVSVKNEKYTEGKKVSMQQDQTLYTCPISEAEAAKFDDNVEGKFLWQFKIEKVQAAKKRIYGKSTKLQIVYKGKVLVDLTNTFAEKGNSFNRVENERYTSTPAQWHVCSWCNGKGWGTGLNDNRRKVCPNCAGKGEVYF